MEKFGIAGYQTGVVNASQLADFYYDGDDFVKLPIDDEDYAFTNATAGDMTLSAAGENGILLLDAVAGTVTQGAQIQRLGASFKPKAGRVILFEANVSVDLLGVEFFAGLAEIDTTIIGTSAVSTANHIAFTSITDDGLLITNAEKAGAGTTGVGYQLVAGTTVKLGIRVDGLDSVSFFVDDVLVSTIATTANIPIVGLAPSFVCQSDGTDAPIMSIDYWRCQQTR